ncbi:aminotransferase [Virgisporangium ochraceum]|uniref:Aminotransferase n=2 Tax=Virgisporangium ochraceum TaxID=65505 RepID=A0A8J4EBL8_9ACTN|nr:aminotransferase [Virgisporangium ochraceum]
MRAAFEVGWADPGKLYPVARQSRQLLDASLEVLAEALGAHRDELHLTAGGTEAAHLAIDGVQHTGAVVHSAVEHSAVIKAANGRAHVVPVDLYGRVDADAFATAVRTTDPAVAALQSANHEVGTTQPVAEVAAACREAGVPLYVDAAQSVGRQAVPGGWSLLSASARKWGGPAGVGVLVVRKGTRWADPRPMAPPVNVPLVVGAAAAVRAVVAEAEAESRRLGALVDRVRAGLVAAVTDIEVVGDPVDRLPHIVTFSCLYVDGEALLHGLAREGFAVSSGSACTADTLRPSHVLAAMGVLTHGNVRVSLHRETTDDEVDRFLAVVPRVVDRLRAEAGVVGL